MLGSVANVKLIQGFGLSTNGGISSEPQSRGTRGQRNRSMDENVGDLPSISTGGGNSCIGMMQRTSRFFRYTRWGMGRGRDEGRLPYQQSFVLRKARGGQEWQSGLETELDQKIGSRLLCRGRGEGPEGV